MDPIKQLECVYYPSPVPADPAVLTVLCLVFDKIYFPYAYLPKGDYDKEALAQEIARLQSLPSERSTAKLIGMLRFLEYRSALDGILEYPTARDDIFGDKSQGIAKIAKSIYDVNIPPRENFEPYFDTSTVKGLPDSEEAIAYAGDFYYQARAIMYADEHRLPLIDDGSGLKLPFKGRYKDNAPALAALVAVETAALSLPDLPPMTLQELVDFRVENVRELQAFRASMLRYAKTLNQTRSVKIRMWGGERMHILQVEIGNFRKLVATRIAFASEKTVFVGANNSGKTSAMNALHRFLLDSRGFTINDFSLAHWQALNAEGEAWEAAIKAGAALPTPNLLNFLPQLDVWLQVGKGEMHYVQKLLPTLDWKFGPLGVRLRYEADDPIKFQQEYIAARTKAADTTAAAIKAAEGKDDPPQLELWPLNLVDFLDRRVRSFFKVKAYLLDPAKLADPKDGLAEMQVLPEGLEPVEGNPLDGLIQIDEISAQRGFGSPTTPRVQRDEARADAKSGRRLSTQLRSYYDNHLDWQDTPELSDIKAMEALDKARKAFDERLSEAFENALKELQKLGYPGISDPKLKIATKLKLQDGLSHDSAVQYEIPAAAGGHMHRLPEDSNGLGYQNLVSMVFGLMSYRDAWMRIGKASASGDDSKPPPPLHLMLVEEPEAYLHAQVQQVFIKHAYDVLRNHSTLGKSTNFCTQLIVSTHSSHVAHACDFAALRYFRRLPPTEKRKTPTACVVNLSSVFGKPDQTTKFVARYLKATHCDLFFTDAAVFIEGSAERILVPYFVEQVEAFEYLRSCYITWLEVGGSHAHRFKGLVETLGLTTLIVTDLDAKDPKTNEVVKELALGKGLEARNETLRAWVPKQTAVDTLMRLEEKDKALVNSNGYAVRAAYQTGTKLKIGTAEVNVHANTFEDALLYRNFDFFKGRKATGLAGKFQTIADDAKNASDLALKVKRAIEGGDKAEFALELLFSDDVEKLSVPAYIEHGLLWLKEQLERKEADLAPKAGAP